MPELRARSKLVPPGSAGNGFERGCRDVEGETPKSCIPPRDCRSFIERFRFERVECSRSDWQSSITSSG